MPRTHPWKVSDEWWMQVAPLIPAAPSHARGGRPRMNDRQAFEAILYVLRTGIQWNALPRELGASSTIHDRFQEWEQKGLFKALWQAGLQDYDEVQGIQWEWQAVDGVMTKAPFGKGATGPNPTDRAKSGRSRGEEKAEKIRIPGHLWKRNHRSFPAPRRPSGVQKKKENLPDPVFYEDDERSARGEQIAQRPAFKKLLDNIIN